MNTDIRVVVISATTALITSGLVALVDYTVREREMDIKMMEIAVGLLKEDPKGPLQPAREWAVDVISYYSKAGVPLSDGASLALKSNPTAEQIMEMMMLMARQHGGQAPSPPAPE